MSKPRLLSKIELDNLSGHFYTKGGKLYAKHKYCARVEKDQEVGCNNGQDYLVVMCNYKPYFVHRIIYFLETGVYPHYVVDHINGNTLDNRIENLRAISQGENTRSYGQTHKGSSSKFRGVHWYKRDSKWQAQIMCCGEKYHLGYFDSEYEAALVWNYKAHELGFNKEAFNRVFEDVEVEYGE